MEKTGRVVFTWSLNPGFVIQLFMIVINNHKKPQVSSK